MAALAAVVWAAQNVHVEAIRSAEKNGNIMLSTTMHTQTA